ncbi:MAG: SPOR domain-containing protein [Gemmatimonadales bacterium]
MSRKIIPPSRLPALLAALAFAAAPLAAQTDSQLVQVVQLAQDGQGDSARALVARILATTSPLDSLYPQVLYTSGLVARTVDDMRRAYQRVAVEFTSSSWADDALLRLALLDYADGNPASALQKLDRIRSDYPDSPLIPMASYWAAKSAFDLKKVAEGCKWLSDGLAGVGDNVELQNQLTYLNGRCSPEAVAQAESAQVQPAVKTPAPKPPAPVPAPKPAPPSAAPTPATAATTATAPARESWSVQIGAVKTQEAADQLVANFKRLGYPSHIVSEGGYLKVRAGPYPDRAAANTAATRIKVLMGGSPYVVRDQ